MLLYHGSNIEVVKPDHTVGRKKLDFGQGFYTTTMPEQAEAWARRRAFEFSQDSGVVSVYDFNESPDLNVLRLEGYSTEWLWFVVNNRSSNSGHSHQYDVVFGSIADDRVIDSINYFIEELASDRMSDELINLTLRQLSYQKPNDQACFATRKSLESLVFLRSYEAST